MTPASSKGVITAVSIVVVFEVIENRLVPKPLYALDSENQIGNIQNILYFRYTQDGFAFLTAIMLHRMFIQFASYILNL